MITNVLESKVSSNVPPGAQGSRQIHEDFSITPALTVFFCYVSKLIKSATDVFAQNNFPKYIFNSRNYDFEITRAITPLGPVTITNFFAGYGYKQVALYNNLTTFASLCRSC